MNAEKHALALGHDRIRSEHLLLGILGLEAGAAVRVFAGLGFEVADLRSAVVESLPRGESSVGPRPRLRFDSHARICLENGMREAIALRSNQIGPEHLLLGILRTGDRDAGALLRGLGVDRAAAQRAVATLARSERLPGRAQQFLKHPAWERTGGMSMTLAGAVIFSAQSVVGWRYVAPGDGMGIVGVSVFAFVTLVAVIYVASFAVRLSRGGPLRSPHRDDSYGG